MQFQEWMFDKRVLGRNLRRGVLQQADYQKYLKSLRDLKDDTAPLVEDDPKRGGSRREQRPDE